MYLCFTLRVNSIVNNVYCRYQSPPLISSVSGPNTENEWAREGRRIIPLLRRATPITAFTAGADAVKQEVSRAACCGNSCTRRGISSDSMAGVTLILHVPPSACFSLGFWGIGRNG